MPNKRLLLFHNPRDLPTGSANAMSKNSKAKPKATSEPVNVIVGYVALYEPPKIIVRS